jgi:hypothetical protein
MNENIGDELEAIRTKLVDLAKFTHGADQWATARNISAVAEIVDLIKTSVLGGFYEEGQKDMLEELTTAKANIESIQCT